MVLGNYSWEGRCPEATLMNLQSENALRSLPEVQHRYITSTHNTMCKQHYRRRKNTENLAVRAGFSSKGNSGAEGLQEHLLTS